MSKTPALATQSQIGLAAARARLELALRTIRQR
jgi:hypothetical protein